MERQSFVFILQKSVLKFLTLPLLVSSIAVRTSVHRTNSSSKFRTCGRKMIFSFPQYRVRSSKFFFRFDVCGTSVSNTKTTVVPAWIDNICDLGIKFCTTLKTFIFPGINLSGASFKAAISCCSQGPLHNRCTYCSSTHPISNSSKSESCGSEANTSFSTAQRKESVFRFSISDVKTAEA